MQNSKLAEDYFRRAKVRLQVLDSYLVARSWADVVRESQETVELALKAVLRASQVDAPRVHDVSQILMDNREMLPAALTPDIDKLAGYSRAMRRDRELAFDGSEDLTPGEFYLESDALDALRMARETVESVGRCFSHLS